MTVSCEVHSPICLPSGEQTDCPAVEQVPVDDDDVEGDVEPEEELVIAEGAELGAAATTGEAAAGETAAGEAAAIEGAVPAAVMDGATDCTADPDAPDAPEAAEAPDAPDSPDAPVELDAPLELEAPLAPDAEDPEDPDEEDPAADALEFDPDDPDDPHLGPVGGVSVPDPNLSTEAPGSGNWTSAESTVVQSVVGMFALNIAGNDAVARSESSEKPRVSLRVVSLFFDPPLTFIDAQFMYISRLPILLNQVQANVYDPGVIPSGIL